MKSIRNVLGAAVMAAVVGMCGSVWAVDVDVLPYASDGTIVTGGIDHATGDVFAERQDVFQGALDNNGVSVTTDEPGYDNSISNPADPHHLTPNGNLHFTVLTNWFSSSRVGYWSGEGAMSWSAAPSGFSVTVASQANPSNMITFDGSATSPTDGFDISEVLDAQGRLHEHMDTFFPVDAPTGIYLLRYQLTSSSLAPSQPISIVLNYGMSDQTGDLAAASVPEPTCASLVLVSAAGLLARRGSRRAGRSSVR